ncbi:hypothetical protein OCH239_09150 [Roseivivax halodurans JCM 10272]|uniref:Uncharacterized protein n=1 Tax=Roseivivax halodurans JCM 10272 TaxID=1449350 RepID=X7ECM7_9RHOB|nr:hypothetical protein OCH239_09150 [Roseivivax halodurans JCM 10272]
MTGSSGLLGIGKGGRDRTDDIRFWRPALYHLSYTPIVPRPRPRRLYLASLEGVEPTTSAVGMQHSIQLSYRDTFIWTDPGEHMALRPGRAAILAGSAVAPPAYP